MPPPDLDLDIPPLLTASVLVAARHIALQRGSETTLAATGASPDEAHAIEVDQLAGLA